MGRGGGGGAGGTDRCRRKSAQWSQCIIVTSNFKSVNLQICGHDPDIGVYFGGLVINCQFKPPPKKFTPYGVHNHTQMYMYTLRGSMRLLTLFMIEDRGVSDASHEGVVLDEVLVIVGAQQPVHAQEEELDGSLRV